jgi:hypothetical protein
VIRLPGGNIATQFPNVPGPAPKEFAVTRGTGISRTVGGERLLVEFGNDNGSLSSTC